MTPTAQALAEVANVLTEMRERRVNHDKHTSPTLIKWADRIEDALAQLGGGREPDKPWYDAVTDACVIACISWDENDPRKSVRQLLDWHSQIALDPAVSSDARALIDHGQIDAFVQGAKWWEWHKTGATMWQSDQQLAYKKAGEKYSQTEPAPPPTEPAQAGRDGGGE